MRTNGGGFFVTLIAFVVSLMAATVGRAQSVYATPYVTSTLAGAPPGSRRLAVDGAPLGFPVAVAVDRQGNVYVAEGDSGDRMHANTIRKITATGVVTLAGEPGISGNVDGTGSEARFHDPSGIAVDSLGNVYVADFQIGTIRKISPGGMVTTLAGMAGTRGSVDGVSSTARFDGPVGIAVDQAGNVFVADANNSTVRKISPAGVVTTFAGSPDSYGNADGVGQAAQFRRPYGIATNDAGDVYVSDSVSGTIRKITAAGVVTTLAGGGGFLGVADGLGRAARFTNPFGLTTDGDGNVYVADRGSHTIRKITPAGLVTTLAGAREIPGSADGVGLEARFNAPYGVAADRAGNIFVADTFNTTIRRINAAGTVTTFAGIRASNGSVDGSGNAARFNAPEGVAVDDAGNIYVADAQNHTIRRISRAGGVTTFAGRSGVVGSDDGITGTAAFALPRDVAVDGFGNVFVADTGNCVIRKISPSGLVTTLAGTAGSNGTQDGVGAAARFLGPQSVAVDHLGNVYVADTLLSAAARIMSSTIRKITPNGIVTTLAGTAFRNGREDGQGADAQFNLASGVAVDSGGNIYVADTGNHAIRHITPTGLVTTFAGVTGMAGSVDGVGSTARFKNPHGIAVDAEGNVFVTESSNHTIRRITPTGLVTTIAGTTGSDGTIDSVGSAARFTSPRGIAVDNAGTVLVADTFNNTVRTLVPSPVTDRNGRLMNVSTRGSVQIGGTLTAGFVMKGTGAKQLLIRGIGPALGEFGVSNPVPDTRVELGGPGLPTEVSNDDWDDSAPLIATTAKVGAFALPPRSKDAALHPTIAVTGGGVTAQVFAVGATQSGIALAEIYDAAPMTAEAYLINVSTLGFVGGGDNVLIAGFSLSAPASKQILIRAVGPGLGQFGIEGVSDPRIELYRAGVSVPVATNDNWGGTEALQTTFVQAGAFVLPASSNDAAVTLNLVPGSYTVVVSGTAGATGNALLEIYDLDP